MILQGIDGQLSLQEFGNNGTTYGMQILFCEMDFSGPSSRPRTEETLVMNRGTFSTSAHYIEGPDDPRYAPIPITFSCRLADTVNTRILSDWISGVTKLTGTTQLYSFKGKTTLDGNTLPNFNDTTGKYAYRVEMLWDTAGSDLGYQYNEVYFPPGQQTISESPDGLTLSANGQCFGDVSRILLISGTTPVIA